MKCVISGPNIKFLARAIQMLSKIGDEMFVQPQEDHLSLRSINTSNSAYADVTFYENYFSYYAYEDLDDKDAFKCKILIRSAMAVFKTPSLLEKQVESCHIQLAANSEKLTFILKYKNNIIKTHLLPILDTETIRANYKKDGTANHLRIQPRVMNDAVQNFQQNLLEITIEVLKEKVLIRNYIDENSNISNETRTQVVFGVGEFDEYTIASDTAITFCLKEFRAILNLAETLAQPIDVHFDRSGRPVVFVSKSDSLETNLVLATLNPDVDSGTQSTVSTRANPIPKKAPTKRAPAKAKGGIKSLSKKSFSNTRQNSKISNNSTHATDIGSTESPGRISNVSESPFQNDKRNSLDSSKTCTPKTTVSNTNVSKAASARTENSIKKNPSSSFLKRKSSEEIPSPNNDLDDEDLVQNSPPRQQSKRAKLIFKKCFQTTFDPRLLPGYNNVEVEDSGESD